VYLVDFICCTFCSFYYIEGSREVLEDGGSGLDNSGRLDLRSLNLA
jgi:hypothetical protein